jgi:hypothetical protein
VAAVWASATIVGVVNSIPLARARTDAPTHAPADASPPGGAGTPCGCDLRVR